MRECTGHIDSLYSVHTHIHALSNSKRRWPLQYAVGETQHVAKDTLLPESYDTQTKTFDKVPLLKQNAHIGKPPFSILFFTSPCLH